MGRLALGAAGARGLAAAITARRAARPRCIGSYWVGKGESSEATGGELSMDIDWDVWSPPSSFICPISGELMADPVTCVDGHSYEKGCILRWFRESRVTSPVTGKALDSAAVFPNHALRNAIEEWKLQIQGDGTPRPPPQPPPPPGKPANKSQPPSDPADPPARTASRSHSVPNVSGRRCAPAASPRDAPVNIHPGLSSPAAVLDDEESAMARAIREARRRRELDARARAEEAAEPEFSHVRAAAEFREAAAARQQRQRRPSRQARQPRQARQARSHGGASGHAGHVGALAHTAAAAATAATAATAAAAAAAAAAVAARAPAPPAPRAASQQQRQRASSAPPRRREVECAPPSRTRRGRPSVPPTSAGHTETGSGDLGAPPAMGWARPRLGGAARRARHGGAAPAARCAHDGGAASTRCGAGVALGRAVGRPPNERAAAPTVEQQAAVPRLRLEGLDAHV